MMADVERVIERFRNLLETQKCTQEDLISARFTNFDLKEIIYLMEDAKVAQERAVPKKYKIKIDTAICPDCGQDLERQSLLGDNVLFHEQFRFCPNCGRRIKWEE